MDANELIENTLREEGRLIEKDEDVKEKEKQDDGDKEKTNVDQEEVVKEEIDEKENKDKNKDENNDKTQSADSDLDVASINRKLGTSYESISELTKQIEESEKLRASLADKDKILDDLNKQISDYQEQLNPLSHFPDKESYVAAQIIKKNPNMNRGAVSKLVTTDLSGMTDVDAIKLRDQLEYPTGVDNVLLEKAIKQKYGLNKNLDNLEDEERREAEEQIKINQLSMAKDAVMARRQLKELVDGVDVPEVKDIETLKAERQKADDEKKSELREKWGGSLKEISEKLTEVRVGDNGFKFEVDKESRDKIVKKIADIVVGRGVEPTDELKNNLLEAAMREYKNNNEAKILKAYREDVLSKAKEEEYQKYHNPKTRNEQEAPEPGEKRTDLEGYLADNGIKA